MKILFANIFAKTDSESFPNSDKGIVRNVLMDEKHHAASSLIHCTEIFQGSILKLQLNCQFSFPEQPQHKVGGPQGTASYSLKN